ncbi:hypothetical protein ACQ4M3_15615 [Leptolyngbya sp. AN03gr2]|uniref:hypothetical protein n=1 Tax=unclassified Leptolyngbya TaxID=2650499 RepID=UPI003D31E38A
MPQTTLQSVFSGLAGVTLAFSGMPFAQAQLPNCQAPRSNEFLLLIVTRTPESQARVRSVVSRTADVSVCNYFGETVTRVGGYKDANTANSWANYLNDTVRLRAFVATPPGGTQVARSDVPRQQPPQPIVRQNELATASAGFNPQRLGQGFAVIVNHYNRPEVAAQVRQVLNRNIGLASFEQRPYLLAVQTTDRGVANSILQTLSDRGFAAMLVRSDRVTLLTPVVQIQPVGGQ